MLYFAYGSNMSLRRLRQRVPSVRVISVATLYGHLLRFHKVGQDGSAKCDAYETGGERHVVFGILFDLQREYKTVLDEFEGLGNGYRDKPVGLVTIAGERVSAVTYVATNIDPVLKPFDWYRQHVLFGATESDLPNDYIEQSIRSIESVEDSDRWRYNRELAIYNC